MNSPIRQSREDACSGTRRIRGCLFHKAGGNEAVLSKSSATAKYTNTGELGIALRGKAQEATHKAEKQRGCQRKKRLRGRVRTRKLKYPKHVKPMGAETGIPGHYPKEST